MTFFLVCDLLAVVKLIVALPNVVVVGDGVCVVGCIFPFVEEPGPLSAQSLDRVLEKESGFWLACSTR